MELLKFAIAYSAQQWKSLIAPIMCCMILSWAAVDQKSWCLTFIQQKGYLYVLDVEKEKFNC